MIAEIINDIRYALRLLTKNPVFTAVVVLTLALGIGANAAIFSLLDKVLLQSLPVANPDQLAVLSQYDPKQGPNSGSSFSYPMYQDLRDRNSVFSGVIARGGAQMNVSYGDQTERLPLLVSAALLVKSLQNLRAVDAGFGKENVLFASVNPSLNGYSNERTTAFYDQLLTRTRALPGVKFASLGSDSPVSGNSDQNLIVVEGHTPREGERMLADVTTVSPDYFKSLEIPLLAGREFDDRDRPGAPRVVIVNEKLAKHYFGTTNAVGKRIGLDDVPDLTIVGVVKDAQYVNLREQIRRHFYVPTTQEEQLSNLTLHVKTTTEPSIVAEQLRAELKALDPHLPLYNIKTLATEIDESLIQERLVTWLSAAFGVLATFLTALGLYGVLTFSVARRTREIGIRVALGAQRRDVFRLIMVRGVILVGLGVAIGVAASIGFSRFISALLFGVAPNSVTTLAGVSVGLIVVALLACYIPARRATKVDPLIALRYE